MVDGRVLFVVGVCLVLTGIIVAAAPAIVSEWLAAKGNPPVTEIVVPAAERGEEPVPVKEPPAITVLVTGADSSETVAKKLQVAGIVSDAVAFNRFLVMEGYARRIQNGNHYLTPGMTTEELAKCLTGMR